MYVYPFLKICRFHGICSVALPLRDWFEIASNNWIDRYSIASTRNAAPIVDYFDCYSNGNWYCCHYDYYYDLQRCCLYHHCRCHHHSRHHQHSAIYQSTKSTKIKYEQQHMVCVRRACHVFYYGYCVHTPSEWKSQHEIDVDRHMRRHRSDKREREREDWLKKITLICDHEKRLIESKLIDFHIGSYAFHIIMV